MKIPCPLVQTAIAGQTAIIYDEQRKQSFAALSNAVDGCCRQLQGRGISRDQVISVRVDRPGPLLTLIPALWRLGAVAQLVSPRFPEAVAARLHDQADSCLDPAAEDLFADNLSGPVEAPMIDLASFVTHVPTSGSTGMPKLVVHRFGNHLANAAGANRVVPLRPADRWLLSLPLYHVGGLGIFFRCLLSGAAVAMPATAEPLGEAIDRLQISHISVVPTQLRRLLNHPCRQWPRYILVGGAPLAADLREEIEARQLPVYTTYGLTEMASQVTTGNNLYDSGTVLAERDLCISPQQEILVRGACLSPGYWQDHRVVDERDADGWFHTGDLGELVDRRLRVFGRRDNMFISGGENVHAEEIEQALLQYSGIEQAVVVARTDPEYGHRPVAFLVGDWHEGELRELLQTTLPKFKIPDVFRPLPPAWRQDVKPDRQRLTELANS